MIATVLDVYGTEVAPHKKSARNIGYKIGHLLRWWGAKTVAQITIKTCRSYVDSKPAQSAGADLKTLKSAVDYWHGSDYGPLNFVPKFWIPPGNEPKGRWLTRGEAARLLWASRRIPHIKRLILLGLYTGSRPGVILALQWDQIDFRGRMMARIRPEAIQDQKKRSPKVKLGKRILTHLRRWKRLDGDGRFVCHFEGRQVQDPHRSWRRAVVVSGVQGITRHTLRHTRATWMMQAGVPIWEAAGFLGMTIKTLEKIYAHHDPDYQERAANI